MSKYEVYKTSREAWDAMYKDIARSEKSIFWEVYIFKDDQVGERFSNLLKQKAQEGLDVRLIFDGLGSFGLPKEMVDELKQSGVDILFFQDRSKKTSWWKRLWSRTHRKILVVDEHIGYVGGVNVGKNMENWLDFQIKLKGRVVRSLLRSFAKTYIIAGGDKKNVRKFLSRKFKIKNKEINFVYDKPDIKHSNARKVYLSALRKSKHRVIFFTPYYFPDKKFFSELIAARKRGVKIDLLMPFRSDVRIATYVMYGLLSVLNKIGVNVYLSKEMMHGKGVVVDDKWAFIGSSNIEKTSFYDLYEANVKIKNKKFVKKIKNILKKWKKNSIVFNKKTWKKRGRIQKIIEWISIQLFNLWHWRKKK